MAAVARLGRYWRLRFRIARVVHYFTHIVTQAVPSDAITMIILLVEVINV
jgi:hypothetical protein